MSNQLSPPLRQMRDALRADRLRREEEAGARGNTDNSAWLATKNNDIQLQVEGITTGAGAPHPASNNSDDLWAVDDGFGPRADSQAKAGGDLHQMLERATEDDSLLLEAAEQSLQETRNETGAQAARTRRAAQQLVGQIKDARISAIAQEFVARSKQETNVEYVADADNYAVILEELSRQHSAGVYVDPDDTEAAVSALFGKHLWTVSNLLQAWKNIVQEGRAVALYEGARPISDSERPTAAIRAASGDVEGGIISLLQVCVPSLGEAASAEQLFAALADPEIREVVFDCVFTCVAATPQALAAGMRDDQPTRTAVYAALGNAPITVSNIRAASSQVQRSRRPASLPEISDAARNVVPSEQSLNDLSDEEVTDLFNSVVKDRSRRVRRGLL